MTGIPVVGGPMDGETLDSDATYLIFPFSNGHPAAFGDKIDEVARYHYRGSHYHYEPEEETND